MANDIFRKNDRFIPHDKAPMQRALATQALLPMEEKDIDFLGNDEWAGNSPDLNATENVGSVTMEKVAVALQKSKAKKKYHRPNLIKVINKVLNGMNEDLGFFKNLITTAP